MAAAFSAVASAVVPEVVPQGPSTNMREKYKKRVWLPRLEAPVPWNMDADERLRRRLMYLNKEHKLLGPLRYFEVLDAAQHLPVDEVMQVLWSFELRKTRIKKPTDWVVEQLRVRTRQKLNLRQMPERHETRVTSTVNWLNRVCEFGIEIRF